MADLKNLAQPLFDATRPGVFTSIGGLSHANYEQHTDGSRHIQTKILNIFDYFGLYYYLFAGSMVGFVRNRAMPRWMDDLDVLIFEDQIEMFEKEIVPYLSDCGFNCFRPGKQYKAGGYHVLALQTSDKDRNVEIPLSEDIGIKVPWGQIDVFYATTDENGIVRSPGAFGLFHRKDIPVDWVKPGRFVEIEGAKRRVFSQYSRDIFKEYGDVHNNIVVATHNKVFLKLDNVAWQTFEDSYNQIVRDTTCALPPSVSQSMVQKYSPKEHSVAKIAPGRSFDQIILNILATNAAEVVLSDDNEIFWVMDLKRILPKLRIQVCPKTRLGLQRTSHLMEFIDSVTFLNEEYRKEYDGYIRALEIVTAKPVAQAENADSSMLAPDLSKYIHGRLIANAGGIFNDIKYTNSLEAFDRMRGKVDLIELDICNASDGLIIAHDGLEKRYGFEGKFFEYTTETFAASKFDNKLTPMTVYDMISRLVGSQTRVICDIKTSDLEDYGKTLDEIKRYGTEFGVMDNLIIQIYNPQDYDALRERGFAHYILALWKCYGNVTSDKAKACIDYCFSSEHKGFRALSIDKVHFLEGNDWKGDDVARYMFGKSDMVFVHGQLAQHEEMLMRKGFGLFSHDPEKQLWIENKMTQAYAGLSNDVGQS